MEILNIKNLKFKYPKSKDFAINDISFSINSGEFILICGKSGCGKTTLLKLLKDEIAPYGDKSGNIYYGNNENKIDSKDIGFILQNPETQIVTDKVWHELAFGLENLSMKEDEIKLRICEITNYFGISDLFRSDTAFLSGGQKQKLNLAAVMAMYPKIIILDEPTSQLDPIAANEFLSLLFKISRELGITVLLSEHRLEEIFAIVDKVMVMDKGQILGYDTPKVISKTFFDEDIVQAFPTAIRIWQATQKQGTCPITVSECRDFLHANYKIKKYEKEKPIDKIIPAISFKKVFFRHSKNSKDILYDCSFTIFENEIFGILGANGCGKTTILKIAAGLLRIYSGSIKIFNKKINDYKANTLHQGIIGLLPQNVTNVFLHNKVEDEFIDILKIKGCEKHEREAIIQNMMSKLLLDYELKNRHPFDLSGGEQQRCALAKILLTNPKILLLDEPTKGIDSYSKNNLIMLLKTLQKEGMTIVMVTHDVEFAALCTDRCAMVFDRGILSPMTTQKFFSQNKFYTTAARRIAKDIINDAITVEQIKEAINEN